MWVSTAARRALVLARAAPLRKTIRFLPRDLVLRNAQVSAAAAAAAGVRPLSISAMMCAPATKKATKPKAAAKKKTTTSKKKPAAKAKAKKPKAKKVVKKKKKTTAKKKPAAKKAKKVLTPEQKERREMVQLKKRALLPSPHQLPSTVWTVFVARNVGKGEGSAAGKMGALGNAYKNLPEGEKENYARTAQANKNANEKERLRWINSYPVEVIYHANLARKRLARKLNKKPILIHDERLPSRALSAYALYIKSNYTRSEGETAPQAFKRMSEKWKSLNENEKEQYLAEAEDLALESSGVLKEFKQKNNAYWKANA